METTLAIVVLGSLFMNLVLCVRLIKVLRVKPEPVYVYMIMEEPKSSEEDSVSIPDTESVTKKEQPALHQAWQNRNNIPWDESTRSKPEPVRSQQPGPRQRPQGFV